MRMAEVHYRRKRGCWLGGRALYAGKNEQVWQLLPPAKSIKQEDDIILVIQEGGFF